MYAFYRLIANEVTNVNRNCVCARACVRAHVREKKEIFGDISLAKRASIMRVAPMMAVVNCSLKT